MTIKELLASTTVGASPSPPKPDKTDKANKQRAVPTSYPTPPAARANHRQKQNTERSGARRGGDRGDDDGDGDDGGDGEAPKPTSAPRLHLDRRAGTLADAVAEDSGADDLLTSRELAAWLGVTAGWVEMGRYKNYGPPFIRLAPQVLRYKRSVVLAWLKEREFASTAQYAGTARRSKKRA